jgi:hypothetical protein
MSDNDLPVPAAGPPGSEIRASDAEREAAVERLRVATQEGRLTLGELTDRSEAAYTAATRGELSRITADLPQTRVAGTPAPWTPPVTGPREHLVAVMSETKRRGHWRYTKPITAVAVMGDITIDLREAEVPGGVVDISATSIMADIKIFVPDGVDLELSGVSIMGDRKAKVREASPGQVAPLIRVEANVIMGDVKIISDAFAEPVKRKLRAWLDGDAGERKELGR